MRSSQAAFDLIVREEIGSKELYTRIYQRPEWPGAASGATIGIGYDLGQTSAAVIRADWEGRVSPAMLSAMLSAQGHTGAAGRTATAAIRNQVLIPWDLAIAVHRERVMPRWESVVLAALPNARELSGDSFGALVSLTFNRGPSFNVMGDRYREMRAIKAHMAAREFGKIPAEFRSMKRLWPNLSGLRWRRDTEARLFERGLGKPIGITLPLPEIVDAQRRLTSIGYAPGEIDGLWGSMTAGAIAGFLNDWHNHPEITPPSSLENFVESWPVIKSELREAEAANFKRPIAEERKEATATQLEKKLPEVGAAKTAERLGLWTAIIGAVTSAITGVAKALGEAIEWINPLRTIATEMPWQVWVVGALAISGSIYYISRKSRQAAEASTQAYQEGRRL